MGGFTHAVVVFTHGVLESQRRSFFYYCIKI